MLQIVYSLFKDLSVNSTNDNYNASDIFYYKKFQSKLGRKRLSKCIWTDDMEPFQIILRNTFVTYLVKSDITLTIDNRQLAVDGFATDKLTVYNFV